MASEDFSPEVCKLRHKTIDKDVSEIKEDIEEIKKEEQDQHEEMKKMMIKLSNEVRFSHQNLKNKIILNDKKMGDKIDELSAFDKSLRGNGDPGVWESVRTNRDLIKNTRKIGYWFVTIITSVIIVLAIITLGGEWQGISKEKKSLKPKAKQVESTPKITMETPKFKIVE